MEPAEHCAAESSGPIGADDVSPLDRRVQGVSGACVLPDVGAIRTADEVDPGELVLVARGQLGCGRQRFVRP
jgi:hypothetical protein